MKRGQLAYKILNIFRWLLPIRANKYFMYTMGGTYGCNPKYLTEYIKSHDSNATIVWGFSREQYKKNKDYVKIATKYGSVRYYIHLFTSHYFISNDRVGGSNNFPAKRMGQIYMHTWHGSGPKKCEQDVQWPDDRYEKGAKKDSAMIDVIISGNHFQTGFHKNSFWYNGPVIETGIPRSDIFFENHPEIVKGVRTYLHIPKGKKMVLYAPTFRTLTDDINTYVFNIHKMCALLQEHLHGEYIFVFRLHPNVKLETNDLLVNIGEEMVINASSYPDMQELLYTADILITDYSSTMFDFALTGKPCFLYLKDVDSYDRGFSIPVEKWPFPRFSNNQEMQMMISSFDNEQYKLKVQQFLQESIGSVEDGHACERCYNLLKSL